MRAVHVGEGARVSSSAEPGSHVVRGASPRRADQVRGFGRAGFRPESRIGRTFRHVDLGGAASGGCWEEDGGCPLDYDPADMIDRERRGVLSR
jgi:hypothetical protein